MLEAVEKTDLEPHAHRLPGHHGAFMREGFGEAPDDARPAGPGGPLAGLRLAVKDVFDAAGQRTGGGNPSWFAARLPARHSAPAVRLLLEAGAGWVGRTVTDELTYSLAGINAHYGTPTNPAAPLRIPGGSSSGSAVAVAARHADIALGTDCGGSIRLPASYNGIWGMRPTHGRITALGCLPLAPSFDTTGWFARSGEHLSRVFEVLAHSVVPASRPARELLVADDVLVLLDAAVRARFEAALPAIAAIAPIRRLPAGTLAPGAWAAALRVLQAAEIAQHHAPWFALHGHTLGADVRQRFERALTISRADVAAAQVLRAEASAQLAAVLAPTGSLLLMPTVPTIAPALSDSPARIDDVRMRSQQLLSLAGLAGLPQASMPWANFDGAPLGISLAGPRGDDEGVLAALAPLQAALA